MKNQPLLSRLGETATLILVWPFSIVISVSYLVAACTLQIAMAIMKVWE